MAHVISVEKNWYINVKFWEQSRTEGLERVLLLFNHLPLYH